MKSCIHVVCTLLIIAFASFVDAQVIINEISYNPPESGTDSLEYIELFNAGNNDVDITGYTFIGIEDTLPAVQLSPGQYYVVAVSASAMQHVFGIIAHQWSSGGGDPAPATGPVPDQHDPVVGR